MNVQQAINALGYRNFIALEILKGELSNVDVPYAEIVVRAFGIADAFIKKSETGSNDGKSKKQRSGETPAE